MKNEDRNNEGTTTDQLNPDSKPTLLIDVDYYDRIIHDPDVDPEYKRQLIDIVGKIVLDFIDIGFGVHPVQQANPSGPQRWAEEHLKIVQQPEKESLPERSTS